MRNTARHWLMIALALIAAAALTTACSDVTRAGPDAAFEDWGASLSVGRIPDLSACPTIAVPAGSKLVVHVYAAGVQKYHWNGSAWSFDGPEAVLSADAAGRSTIGTHYEGPTWESMSGGTVVGTVLERCTPDPSAIQWLLLSAVGNGPGIFHRVSYIQRVNTVGGLAPSAPGTFIGEEARVPYTTEYLFYRSK